MPRGRWLAWLLEARLDEAQAAFQRSSSEPFREMGTALVEHARGHARESQQALEHLIATSGKESTYQIAEVYAFRASGSAPSSGWSGRSHCRTPACGTSSMTRFCAPCGPTRAMSRYSRR